MYKSLVNPEQPCIPFKLFFLTYILLYTYSSSKYYEEFSLPNLLSFRVLHKVKCIHITLHYMIDILKFPSSSQEFENLYFIILYIWHLYYQESTNCSKKYQHAQMLRISIIKCLITWRAGWCLEYPQRWKGLQRSHLMKNQPPSIILSFHGFIQLDKLDIMLINS